MSDILSRLPLDGWKTAIGAFVFFVLPAILRAAGQEEHVHLVETIGGFLVTLGVAHKFEKVKTEVRLNRMQSMIDAGPETKEEEAPDAP